MKNIIRLIFTPIIVFVTHTSSAVVLTFDDVPGGSIQDEFESMSSIPSYKGFYIGHLTTRAGGTAWIDLVDSPWNYGAHSGEFGLTTGSQGGVITEVNDADFTFDGLWAKQWNTTPNSGGIDESFGSFSGWNNGSLVWEVEISLNGSYSFYGSQAGVIDRITLPGPTWLIDDIVLNAVVPVPAAAWLFGSGLIGLVGFARREKA